MSWQLAPVISGTSCLLPYCAQCSGLAFPDSVLSSLWAEISSVSSSLALGLFVCLFIYLFIYGSIRGIRKFPGLGLNLSCIHSYLQQHTWSSQSEFKKLDVGGPIIAQWKQIWLGTMRLRIWSLASLSRLRIWYCHELWCRWQLRSGIAKAGA